VSPLLSPPIGRNYTGPCLYQKEKKKVKKRRERKNPHGAADTWGPRGEGGEEAVKNVTTKRAVYGDGECVWLPDKERGSGGNSAAKGREGF
jgi:hypothetical protein